MRFRTREETERHLATQRTSGMSVAAYCRKEKIAENTFYNWRKRFSEALDSARGVPFIKVPFAAPSSAERIELVLPNGARISMPLGFDVSLLRDVVRVLASLRSCG